MATLVFTNAYIVVNAVDLSDHCRSVEVTISVADVDESVMGDTGVGRLGGLEDSAITATFAQDYASAKVDATIGPLASAKTKHTVAVRPVNAAISTTNPEYTGSSCLITDYNPVAGSIGDLLEAEVSWVVDGVLTRDTTP